VPAQATILEPRFLPGLPDEAVAFAAAVRDPIASPPLRDLIRATDRVAIVIPDITRPFPSDRVLPWLLAELAHVASERLVIVNGTGAHRANTLEELDAMVGRAVAARYRIVNHDSQDPTTMEPAGRLTDGHPVLMNRDYVRADKRIVLGFIEPHFFAGYSGGYKAVCPGIVDIATIMHYHRAALIGDARSTWGVLDGNPTQEFVRDAGSLLPVDFCVNVTLNRRRDITGFFCGRVKDAHEEGCRFARASAMVACPRPYPLVVTTNGGYPLDQNLYQAVKGMSAAAQVVADGGQIVCAARCNDGFPTHGNFRRLLFEYPTPAAMLAAILAPGFSVFDQWEAQKLAIILQKASVALFSQIPADEVARAHLEPVPDLQRFLDAAFRRLGDPPIAILPEGPMTIPYITG
jgi:nickel-dependent lactate racemase